jgi:hypothetical protein
MQCTFGDEDLIARLGNEPAACHLHLKPPFGDGHQLVSSVDEVVPFTARGINEQVARVSTCAPVRRDRSTVHRPAKFFLHNMISHGLAETFNPVLQAAQLEFQGFCGVSDAGALLRGEVNRALIAVCITDATEIWWLG